MTEREQSLRDMIEAEPDYWKAALELCARWDLWPPAPPESALVLMNRNRDDFEFVQWVSTMAIFVVIKVNDKGWPPCTPQVFGAVLLPKVEAVYRHTVKRILENELPTSKDTVN